MRISQTMTSRRRLIRFIAVSIAGCICVSRAISVRNEVGGGSFARSVAEEPTGGSSGVTASLRTSTFFRSVEAILPTQNRRDEQPVRVWCGTYRFAHDPFFTRAVKAGQIYVDANARGKQVSAERFRAEMNELRKIAPADGQVLLDELEHRWAYPQAPPALYVVTCDVCVPQRFALVAGDEELGQEALSTKVGQASRSLAPRISRYCKEGIAGVSIPKGSLALRVVVYGHGPSMVREGELKQVAKKNGVRLERVDEGGERLPVTTETFAGDAMVDVISAFARERVSA